MAKLCVTKLCVSKLCVEERGGGGGGGGGGAGYRIQNKNPTQRCGEKQEPHTQRCGEKWRVTSCVEVAEEAEEEEDGRRGGRDTETKTRTPHKDVGKKNAKEQTLFTDLSQ